MREVPLGWDELFDPARAESDSLPTFLATSHALAAGSQLIVDVGCGRGEWSAEHGTSFQDFRGAGRTVVGIDVDPVGIQNPMIDEFRLIEDDRWPLDTSSVDLAVSDFTLEHVRSPTAFVGELTRVLRPGGAFVARTVSRYSLLSSVARLVPNPRHPDVLSKLQPRRQARDVFPTAYLMNSERALRRLLDADFDWAVTHRTGVEQYLLRTPRLARAAAVVETRLPRSTRTTLVVTARKR